MHTYALQSVQSVKHVLSCPSLCLLSVVLCISECCAELYNPRVMTSQTEGALSFLKRKGCAILLRASDYMVAEPG